MKRETMNAAIEERFLAPQLRPERKNRASLGMTGPLFAALVFLGLLSGVATSLHAQVTAQRLVDSAKEPQNWLMYSGDYAGRRFSALEQINTSNAAMLVPKWAYQTMAGGKFETTPLVVDGILYGTGQDNRAFALDARSGRSGNINARCRRIFGRVAGA